MVRRPTRRRTVSIALTGVLAVAGAAMVAIAAARDVTRHEFVASMDATIRGDDPGNVFGERNRLAVDAVPPEAALIRFDVEGLGTDARATTTTLRLFVVNGSTDGGQISLVASDWNETDAVWDSHGPPLGPLAKVRGSGIAASGNAPGAGSNRVRWIEAPAPGAVIADIGPVERGTWIEIGLGSLVGVDGPHSVLLTSTASNGADYASRETDTPPTLIVDTTPMIPEPTGSQTVAPTITPPTTTAPTTTRTSTSPTSPTTTSPPSATLRIAGVADLCGPDCDRVATLVRANTPDLIVAPGDLAYPDGTIAQFMANYDPAWGAFKPITRSVPGNHEWHTPNAQGWRDYFGVGSGSTYRSFDEGGWHFIGLDSNCSEVGGCTPGSPQYEWLVDDLASMTERCSIAFYHHATFSDGEHGDTPNAVEFWRAMDAAGVDIVLAGHDHTYQRFAPQRADGTADPRGIREFVVGTGGAGLYAFDATPQPNRAVGISEHGALFVTLRDGSYSWEWKDLSGAVRDSGTADCT